MILGLHHVSMKCGTQAEFLEAKAFYTGVLGFSVVREWPEGVMIGFGNGMIEIFSNGDGVRSLGAIRHVAFATDDADAAARRVAEAGYEVFDGPRDVVIRSDPPYPARVAFCRGPLGEEIEFFEER